MEMFCWAKLRCTLVLSLLSASSASTSDYLWVREQTFDNMLSTTGYEVLAYSRLDCGRQCSKSETCLSFFFAPGQEINCRLHDTIMTSSIGLTYVPSSKYYILDGASSPTTTTAPAPTTTTASSQTTTSLPNSTTAPLPAPTTASLPDSTTAPLPAPTTAPSPAPTTAPPPAPTTAPLPDSTTTPLPAPTTAPPPAPTTAPLPAPTTAPLPDSTTTPLPDSTTAPLPDSTTTPLPAPTTTLLPAPTAAPLLLACHANDKNYRTVLLTDDQVFTYTVMTVRARRSQAISSCEGQGGFLARVTTLAKMEMLSQLLTCPEFSGSDYYVDGSNADAIDFLSSDAWVMRNGDQVPMSNDFWGTGCPNNAGSDHCLRMKAEISYKWEDCSCNDSNYFICEK